MYHRTERFNLIDSVCCADRIIPAVLFIYNIFPVNLETDGTVKVLAVEVVPLDWPIKNAEDVKVPIGLLT